MNPSDIATILTAAAPIVASIASGISANNKSEEPQRVIPERTVNVTINNHFYGDKPELEAKKVADQIQNQVVSTINGSDTRYNI